MGSRSAAYPRHRLSSRQGCLGRRRAPRGHGLGQLGLRWHFSHLKCTLWAGRLCPASPGRGKASRASTPKPVWAWHPRAPSSNFGVPRTDSFVRVLYCSFAWRLPLTRRAVPSPRFRVRGVSSARRGSRVTCWNCRVVQLCNYVLGAEGQVFSGWPVGGMLLWRRGRGADAIAGIAELRNFARLVSGRQEPCVRVFPLLRSRCAQ